MALKEHLYWKSIHLAHVQNGCKKFKRGNSGKHGLDYTARKGPWEQTTFVHKNNKYIYFLILNDIDNKYVQIILTAEVKSRTIFILTVYLQVSNKETIWTVSIEKWNVNLRC